MNLPQTMLGFDGETIEDNGSSISDLKNIYWSNPDRAESTSVNELECLRRVVDQ